MCLNSIKVTKNNVKYVFCKNVEKSLTDSKLMNNNNTEHDLCMQ